MFREKEEFCIKYIHLTPKILNVMAFSILRSVNQHVLLVTALVNLSKQVLFLTLTCLSVDWLNLELTNFWTGLSVDCGMTWTNCTSQYQWLFWNDRKIKRGQRRGEVLQDKSFYVLRFTLYSSKWRGFLVAVFSVMEEVGWCSGAGLTGGGNMWSVSQPVMSCHASQSVR